MPAFLMEWLCFLFNGSVVICLEYAGGNVFYVWMASEVDDHCDKNNKRMKMKGSIDPKMFPVQLCPLSV